MYMLHISWLCICLCAMDLTDVLEVFSFLWILRRGNALGWNLVLHIAFCTLVIRNYILHFSICIYCLLRVVYCIFVCIYCVFCFAYYIALCAFLCQMSNSLWTLDRNHGHWISQKKVSWRTTRNIYIIHSSPSKLREQRVRLWRQTMPPGPQTQGGEGGERINCHHHAQSWGQDELKFHFLFWSSELKSDFLQT